MGSTDDILFIFIALNYRFSNEVKVVRDCLYSMYKILIKSNRAAFDSISLLDALIASYRIKKLHKNQQFL